jgi:hypothetical protein
MFNLTLTNFPNSNGLFSGRITLGNENNYMNPFNIKIDYYKIGFIPTIQIRAFNCIYPESFEIKVFHKPTIKAFIRICNLSQEAMVRNQLKSAITIGKRVTGKYLRLNFNRKGLYLSSGIGT